MGTKKLVQGALLIAVAVILQSLRLFIPLPMLISTFIIGSLVNMMLVVVCIKSCMAVTFILTLLLPVFAYFQGQLLLPILIPVVIFGNLCYVYAVRYWQGGYAVYIMPAVLKTVAMTAGAKLLMLMFHIGGAAAGTVLFAMSIPQLITGIAGVTLGKRIIRYLK